MKKIKELVSAGLIIAACLSSSTAFAQGNTLDINAVLNSAVQSSSLVKSMNNSIKRNQNSYNQATKSAASADGQLDHSGKMTDDEKFQLITSRDVNPAQDKFSIVLSQNAEKVAENQVAMTIYQQYVLLMDDKDALDTEQDRLNNAAADYKNTQLKSTLGMASNQDVLTKQSAYLTEQAKFNSVKRKYDLQTMLVNQAISAPLGAPLDTSYDSFLEDKLTENPYIRPYNDYLNDALKNRSEILDATENINLSKFEFNVIVGFYPDTFQPQYKNGQYYITNAQNNLDNAKINISLEINSLYDDLVNKTKALDSQKQNIALLKKQYNEALQNYNLGMISKTQVDSQNVTLQDAENQLKSQERDVWIAQTKINYACGIGADTSKLPTGDINASSI